MGLRSRRKGAGGEREVVSLARAAGLAAERTWHLAQSPNERERCDVVIAGEPYQVKRTRDGFGKLYEGLDHVSGMFVRVDGREWLAVVPAEVLLGLLERSGGVGNTEIIEGSESGLLREGTRPVFVR